MIGFNFDGKHSLDFGIYMKSTNRTLLPQLRKREIEIPGRNGVYDHEGNTYENKLIQVKCGVKKENMPSLRQSLRQIAGWLKNKGKLRFDDELDKYYIGRVYATVPLENLLGAGIFTLAFECEPFAYSETNTTETTVITPENIFIYNNGTVETPEEITITNLGSNTIRGFKIKFIKAR